MTKLRFFLLTVIIVQLPFFSSGQFSRQQAINLVLNQILAADTSHINIYASYDTIPDTINIKLINNQTISPPYPYNWVFFSDDNPSADWYHSCRFIFINSNTGDFAIDSSICYPIDLQTNYQAILLTYTNPPCYIDPCWGGLQVEHFPTPIFASENPHLYAVLINGIDDWSTACDINRDYDMAVVYNTLREAGYMKNHIITLYADGEGKAMFHGDFDGPCCGPGDCTACTTYQTVINHPATWDLVNTVFKNKKDSLTPEDQLFVYITGPGVLLPNNEPAFECYTPLPHLPHSYYTRHELIAAAQNINCAQMIFIMQQDFSGGFIDSIKDDQFAKCRNRVVISATDDGSNSLGKSYKELWVTCGNIDEFTFYFTAALRGYYEGRWPWQWSRKVGTFPFTDHTLFDWDTMGCISPHREHPSDYNPDSGTPPSGMPGNNDGYTQLIEAFNYAKCMDTWNVNGCFYNQNNKYSGSPPNNQYPINCNIDFETPMIGISSGFGSDNLYCLNGIAGNTTSQDQDIIGFDQNTNTDYSYLLGGNVNLRGKTTIGINCRITIGTPVSAVQNCDNKSLSISNGFILKGLQSDQNDGLFIHPGSNLVTIDNATFINAYLQNCAPNLSITNSHFTNCPQIFSHSGNVTIHHSYFDHSRVFLSDHNQSPDNTAIIYNNFFDNTSDTTSDPLWIESYPSYHIHDNTILGGLDGIGLFFSGSRTGPSLIEKNTIALAAQCGIDVYSSIDTLSKNQISNSHHFGIKLLDNSSTSLLGDPNALSYEGTQQINDNDGIEIYAADHCLPYLMRYNAIVDEDNGGGQGDPLLYYDNSWTYILPKHDVEENCWGSHFDYDKAFYANYGIFKYFPIVCPDNNGGGQMTMDEEMYNTATDYCQQEKYTDAKSTYQLLIETYPESPYAKASMRDLLSIEPYAGNDFSGLRTYYLTNDSIQADSTLAKLGDFLANSCNVQLENYPDAISWYENKIENPEIPSDSIFAIIDLGHLYLMMDTTGQSPTYAGRLTQFKPTSMERYSKYRDSLIALLPMVRSTDPLNKQLAKLQAGKLLQNIPNPFSSSTDIYYRLLNVTSAEIRIYDHFGRLIQIIPVNDLNNGIHEVQYISANLSPGIYEYLLTVNGKRTDTKRMIVEK